MSRKAYGVNAFVCMMQEDRPFGIPSHLYVNICRQGYVDFSFDTETLAAAYVFSEQKAMKQQEIN